MRNLIIGLILSLGLCTTALGAKHLSEDQLIAKFARTNILYFFYDSGCPVCEDFAPILKDVTTEYRIKVIAISVDGGSLEDFPATKIDRHKIPSFYINGVPQVFAYNIYTHKKRSIANGGLNETQLRDSILRAAKYQRK